METISINIYQFSELSEDAKKVAIEQWRETLAEEDTYYREPVYDDAKLLGEILGISIDKIYYSGFWSQGDGACFVGSYCYAKGSVDRIRQFAPEDGTLHGIADRLYEVQKRNFYDLEATVKHNGYYYHEYTADITVDRSSYKNVSGDTEDEVVECLRDFMRWIYGQLKKEYEYMMSDESIIESIENNEIMFTINGKQYY